MKSLVSVSKESKKPINDFTMNIPKGSMDHLRELACAETLSVEVSCTKF